MEKPYKVLVAGDRNWTGPELEDKIEAIFTQLPKSTIIIHGGCKGWMLLPIKSLVASNLKL